MDCSGTKRPAPVAMDSSGTAMATTGASTSGSAPSLVGGPDAKRSRPAVVFAAVPAPASLPPQTTAPARWAIMTETIDREGGETKKLGLRDLFYPSARRQQQEQEGQAQGEHNAHRRFPIQQQQRGGGQQQQQGPNDFFTFRLEHRSGGVMARHVGEERILLFRSDRPGAVAKIIYSSTGAPASKPPSRSSADDAKSCGEYGEEELKQMAQAKIHVLDVKEPYRGRDLGGLLFSEAVLSLRDHYGYVEDDEDVSEIPFDQEESARVRAVPPLSASVRCQLDAEEDVRRHNKLIGFYEALGCSIKPKAKIQYLNNNDGETYRKVPMQMALQSSTACQKENQKLPAVTVGGPQEGPRPRRHVTSMAKSLVGQRGGFLPVQLLESSGRKIGSPLPRRTDWILADDGDGGLSIRTTQGHRIVTTHDGRVVTLSSDDGSDMECSSSDDGMCDPHCSCPGCSSDEWGTFRLCRIPDNAAVVSDSEASDAESLAPDDESRRKELWMLRSSHGTFLTFDPMTRSLSCSSVPAFWQANNADLSLRCTTDTPPRRIHYRHTWKTQCVDYVRRMRARYLTFGLGKMDVRSALEMAKTLPCHPYRVNGARASPSLRTFLFRLADAIRLDGYPDWMQMAALVHELGRVVSLLDLKTAAEVDATGYDWALPCRSRAVGCAPVRRASFREFHSLNPDRGDGRYNTALGMYEEHCGLENVLMTWTGPEYVYHMLRNNGVSMPDEGFRMIRLHPLGDWHEHGEYEHLANEDDEDARSFVSDFYWMRRKVQRECDGEDLSDQECQRLWDGYFSNILEKYHCGGQLSW